MDPSSPAAESELLLPRGCVRLGPWPRGGTETPPHHGTSNSVTPGAERLAQASEPKARPWGDAPLTLDTAPGVAASGLGTPPGSRLRLTGPSPSRAFYPPLQAPPPSRPARLRRAIFRLRHVMGRWHRRTHGCPEEDGDAPPAHPTPAPTLTGPRAGSSRAVCAPSTFVPQLGGRPLVVLQREANTAQTQRHTEEGLRTLGRSSWNRCSRLPDGHESESPRRTFHSRIHKFIGEKMQLILNLVFWRRHARDLSPRFR